MWTSNLHKLRQILLSFYFWPIKCIEQVVQRNFTRICVFVLIKTQFQKYHFKSYILYRDYSQSVCCVHLLFAQIIIKKRSIHYTHKQSKQDNILDQTKHHGCSKPMIDVSKFLFAFSHAFSLCSCWKATGTSGSERVFWHVT